MKPLENERTDLYRFYSNDGCLLYIGITADFEKRLNAHRSKPWFANVSRHFVQTFNTRAEAKAAEKQAIQSERPVYNRQYAARDLMEHAKFVLSCDVRACSDAAITAYISDTDWHRWNVEWHLIRSALAVERKKSIHAPKPMKWRLACQNHMPVDDVKYDLDLLRCQSFLGFITEIGWLLRQPWVNETDLAAMLDRGADEIKSRLR